MTEGPTWEQSLAQKHDHQIEAHEAQFGKLGELQTPEQKKALAKALKEKE